MVYRGRIQYNCRQNTEREHQMPVVIKAKFSSTASKRLENNNTFTFLPHMLPYILIILQKQKRRKKLTDERLFND